MNDWTDNGYGSWRLKRGTLRGFITDDTANANGQGFDWNAWKLTGQASHRRDMAGSADTLEQAMAAVENALAGLTNPRPGQPPLPEGLDNVGVFYASLHSR